MGSTSVSIVPNYNIVRRDPDSTYHGGLRNYPFDISRAFGFWQNAVRVERIDGENYVMVVPEKTRPKLPNVYMASESEFKGELCLKLTELRGKKATGIADIMIESLKQDRALERIIREHGLELLEPKGL